MAGARSLLRETLDTLSSLVFPAACRICEATLVIAGRIPICPECLALMKPLTGPMCARCGRPFSSPLAAAAGEPLCHLCRRDAYAFDRARSYAIYDDVMVRAVTLLKYHAVTPLGGWFAARLAELVTGQADLLRADVVVPVPLHPSRQRERGYNQAELIAKPLARRIKLPLRSYLLVRTRPRPDKLRLSRKDRWRTVRGAYATRAGTQVDNLRVLLVDDVFTTGATLDACARALRKAGAVAVIGLTVARVVPDWVSAPRAAGQ